MQKPNLKPAAKQAQPVETAETAKPRIAANDTLYGELEMRYGGAFAQWVVDGLGI